jgi:hypothetical protein
VRRLGLRSREGPDIPESLAPMAPAGTAHGAGRKDPGARLPWMGKADTGLPVSLEPDPIIEAYKRDVDRTLLRERLKRSVEERLRDLSRMQAIAEELRRAGRQTFR